MKVKELIAKLQEFDEELLISIPLELNVNGQTIAKDMNILQVIKCGGTFLSERRQEKVLLISE
jgi:hypothetical protein